MHQKEACIRRKTASTISSFRSKTHIMANCALVDRKVIVIFILSILLLLSVTYSVYITFKVSDSPHPPHPTVTDCPTCPTCKAVKTTTFPRKKNMSTLENLQAIELEFRGCDCCQCKHTATRFNACLTDALDLEDADDVAFLLFFEVLDFLPSAFKFYQYY